MARPFLRQSELLTPGDLAGADIDLAGGGCLGGGIVILLCKMGCGIENRITVTDPDVCEPHNLPGQWFRASDVAARRPKVEALAEMAQTVCERRIETRRERFTGAEARRLGSVVILAVDGIEERAAIWRNLKHRRDVGLLVDARMGGEIVEVHALIPGRDPHVLYERSLHDPKESFHEPSGRRAIASTALAGAALVGSLLCAYVKGREFPRRLDLDLRNFWLET